MSRFLKLSNYSLTASFRNAWSLAQYIIIVDCSSDKKHPNNLGDLTQMRFIINQLSFGQEVESILVFLLVLNQT
ncbi:hypothetical protein E1171_05810 [Cytophagales bacterium RKSG123]|nr:hypothetical protein [Xanthovirga aplysinae]